MKKAPVKNKKVTINDLKVSIDDLTGLMTRGFERVSKEIGEVKRGIIEARENLASTRGDVLAVGDRFTLKYEFYDLSTRVGLLEQKRKTKRQLK